MAFQFATSQIIRIVTDRVLENVTRQLAQTQTAQSARALEGAPPEAAQLLAQLNAGLVQLQAELSTLEERLDLVERRMARLEKRWGWVAMARVVLAVVVAFLLGLVMYHLLRWGGWIT